MFGLGYAWEKVQAFLFEGKVLINGWNLLIEKLRALGLQGCSELPKPHWETKAHRGAEFQREGFSHEVSFAEVTKNGCGRQASAWVSNCMPRGDLGSLKFCLVGSWKTQPDPSPSLQKLEAWAKVAWRLKENVLFDFLN